MGARVGSSANGVMKMDRFNDLQKQGFMRSVNNANRKAICEASKPFDEAAWAKRCVENSRKAYERMWGKDWAHN